MSIDQAIKACQEGHFVTNEYFSADQSMHMYQGRLYYEDGPVVQERWLRNQDFAIHGKWSICIQNNEVDKAKLDELHKSGIKAMSSSYMDCKILKNGE